MDEQTTKRLQNLQALEQDFQQLLMQKQTLQIEDNESKTALEELDKIKNQDVYRVLGSIMLKANPQDLKKEIKEKQVLIGKKLQLLEKQELSLRENIERIRNDIMSKMS